MNAMDREIHIDRGIHFFSGLHCYLSYPELLRISDVYVHKLSEDCRTLWDRLLELNRDQVRFFESLTTSDQQILIRWYNDRMGVHGDDRYVVTSQDVYTTYGFLAYINTNIEHVCADIWPEYREHYIKRYYECMSGYAWSFYNGLDAGNKRKLLLSYT